jgi:hypothetical protein
MHVQVLNDEGYQVSTATAEDRRATAFSTEGETTREERIVMVNSDIERSRTRFDALENRLPVIGATRHATQL